MKTTLFLITGIATGVLSVIGADADLRATVSAAAKNLAAQSSFSWRTTIETPGAQGSFGGGVSGPITGQFEQNGYTHVSPSGSSGLPEFVTNSGKAAVKVEDNWMTLEQASSRSGIEQPRFGPPVGFNLSSVTDFKMPFIEAEELLEATTDFIRLDDALTATLRAEVVIEALSPRGRGGRRGRRGGGGLKNPKGTVTFSVINGVLAQVTVALSGSMEFRGNERSLNRITTTTISNINSTKIYVPADAKEIVEALIDGRASTVFVPEPGFIKLFNGRDLTGWSGRSEHWSVKDRAITGITTQGNPARGNNFLIARDGDKNRIVDDFELRFAYRITANNDSGFANSGMQYRSVARDNYVVAGYQADFEASTTFSGILYDEGGGAGGRGIMAQRGQSVVWNADADREVTGQVGNSEEIQAAIRKNDWNDYVIVARGNHLQHFINGKQTVDVLDYTEGKHLTSGVMALQIHAGDPMTVQCKDIQFKSLSGLDVVAASSVKVAKDFKLEMLYSVPKETQGSWVAICLDPKGRLIVSDQNGKLYRLTPPPVGRAGAIEPELIDLAIGQAHGLLYAFESLYVMVNEGRMTHGLYRVRDTNGDDQFDKVELLRAINGSGEHGLHSLILSPDGKSIYVVNGDSSRLTEIDSSRVPLNWSEDHLLTRLTTRFMANTLAPGGYIVRTDPDGKEWELISTGFRNQFDAAFNREGELFTYDADMEWDIGDPWYRPTRVNHVISAAEFGWRNGAGKWPDYYFDSFGSVVDVGPGSPTGIAFGYGAKFPAKYQNALFISDWSFGKLRAVHLTPTGGSYTGEVEEFISGQPFPVADVIVNPTDGAMYVVVGGRRAQSALYRVTYTGTESTAPSQPDTRFAAYRDIRRKLESFHGHQDRTAVDTVWPYLSEQDRAIRYAARIALEWQSPDQWQQKALDEKDARKAIAALAALARVSSKDEFHRESGSQTPETGLQSQILRALNTIDWTTLSTGDRVDLMRTYSLAFTRLGRPEEETRQRLITRFDPLFPAQTRELNSLLSNMLVYLQAPSAASKIMGLLRGAPSQQEQIEYVLALRLLRDGWTMPLREEYFSWFVTKGASYRGGNTFASSMQSMKKQAIEGLTEAEKIALKPILEAAPERRSPLEILATRSFVKEWTVDELIPIVETGLNSPRNFERGRNLYGQVACAACHRFSLDGGLVGPELTSVAGRFGVRDLLESVVEPNKTISDQYQAIIIEKKNGDIVSGRIGNLSGAGVNVVEDMFDPGRMTTVRRADIESITHSSVSMMPEGLLNTLKKEEIQDLMAFLLARSAAN